MILLVSTSQGLFEVNSETEKHTKIKCGGGGMVYGVTFDDSRIYAFFRPGKMVVLDRETNKIIDSIKIAGLNDVHQAQVKGNNIWVVNSAANNILVIDKKNGQVLTKVYPEPDKRDSDINHFNSVHFHEDAAYIIAHNKTKKTKIPSKCYVLNKTHEVTETILCGSESHNVAIYNNELVTLNSQKREIRINNTQVYKTEGFCRGLAITEKYIIVGNSEILDRDKREKSTGSIEIIDIPTKKLVQKIILKNKGQILEIRVLDEKDFAHN